MNKRITAEEYKALSAAYPQKKKSKRQQETVETKADVAHLNNNNYGFFYRVKSAGTFDVKRRVFRKNNDLVGIPDICGFTVKPAIPVYIEKKRVLYVERKKKLTFKVKITLDQCDFLLRAHRAGCIAGVSFNLADTIAIVNNDPVRYPRHPRTFCFLPKAELDAYAEHYKTLKHDHAEANQDPMTRVRWVTKP